MTVPVCYLICGFLGAGKTTYSKKISNETGAIHLNPDEWCVKLFSKEEYEQNWDACFSKTIEYLWKEAEEYAKQRTSLIFDMEFWTKLSRDKAIKKAVELGFSPIIHYVYAQDKVLKERISKRTGVIADYNFKHFDEIKKQFEEPIADECVIKINNG